MEVKKLNFNVDIDELRQYYNTVSSEFDHLKWSWERCRDTIVDQWRIAAEKDPANLLTQGWAIQSNLEDLSIPCPPWNISTHEIVEYRNTELVFGIIKRLQEKMPYGYRWALSVQPPGGKVGLHSDQEDESTVWIPIYTDGPAITFCENDKEYPTCLEADGSAYLLDTTVPHYTSNTSSSTRVTIIFRINKSYEDEIQLLL